MSNLRWKVVTILAVFVVFFGLGVYPILASRYHLPAPGWLMDKQLKLGLDLKGGVHLVLRVRDRRCAAAGDRAGDGAAARRAEDAQHPGHEHRRARPDALQGRRRAAGAGRGVPHRRQRGAGELRSRLRHERQLHLHDEAEHPAEPARRVGGPGAPDDRAPHQRARRRRAEHRAAGRRSDPRAAARRHRRRARQEHHRIAGPARAEDRRRRAVAVEGSADGQRPGAAGHGDRAGRRLAPATRPRSTTW